MAQCPKCHAQNPDDAFFCGECGTQLKSNFALPHDKAELEAAAGEPVAGPGVPPPPPPAGEKTSTPETAQTPGTTPPDDPSAPPPPPQPPGASYRSAENYRPPAYPPGYGSTPAKAPPLYDTSGGNTSGMGEHHAIPPEATGWTFAGCIPFGIFAFANNSVVWGLVCLAGHLFPIATLVYFIYIGIQGRELAWRNKRFHSIDEYRSSMRSWNRWGLVIGGILTGCSTLGVVAYMLFVFYLIGSS